jgi:hypothetical protein
MFIQQVGWTITADIPSSSCKSQMRIINTNGTYPTFVGKESVHIRPLVDVSMGNI